MTGKNKNGIFFLDKPRGETSFQSLNRIKRALSTRKVGHTGTLDKFATGLLIVLTGKYTRLNSLITGMDKVYEAEITFGVETDTLDPEGAVVAEAPIPQEQEVKQAMLQFLGDQEQTPPLYSAVHINGERAHKLARKGVPADVPSRRIHIYSFDFLSYSDGCLKARVHCSKGTYIRSLARDLGLACKSRAYVTSLKRTAIGPYRLDESINAENLTGSENFFSWKEFFSRLDDSVILKVRDESMDKIAHGVPFRNDFLVSPDSRMGGLTVLEDSSGQPAAILSVEEGRCRYRIIFN